jgi:hypothetical protein
MDIRTTPQRVRELTTQQRQFVRAILDGRGRIDAYRTEAASHGVSVQAYRLWKNPRVQAAIALGQKGDLTVLISCGYDLETCLIKKCLLGAEEARTPPYVRAALLRHAETILQRRQATLQSGPQATEKSSGMEEIERILRQIPAPADENDMSDDLSLDDDLPLLSETQAESSIRERVAVVGGWPGNDRGNSPQRVAHPFLRSGFKS